MGFLFRYRGFCPKLRRESWRVPYFALELHGEHHEVVCTSAAHAKARKWGGLVGPLRSKEQTSKLWFV